MLWKSKEACARKHRCGPAIGNDLCFAPPATPVTFFRGDPISPFAKLGSISQAVFLAPSACSLRRVLPWSPGGDAPDRHLPRPLIPIHQLTRFYNYRSY